MDENLEREEIAIGQKNKNLVYFWLGSDHRQQKYAVYEFWNATWL